MTNKDQLQKNDRLRLLKLGIGKGFFDKEIEALSNTKNSQDNTSHADFNEPIFNHYKIKLNFLGFRTPKVLTPTITYPERTRLSFKFFNFDETHTPI